MAYVTLDQLRKESPKATEKPQWRGRPILKEEHSRDLDHAAASAALRSGSTKEGEQAAYEAYTRSHLLDSAAHHYHAASQAQLKGNSKLADRHLLKYADIARKLRIDPAGHPPPEVGERLRQLQRAKRGSGFRAHPGDVL